MYFNEPLKVQRQRCITISKASCIRLNNVISEPKKKVWKTNFNPHKVNTKIEKHLGYVREMLESIDRGDYNTFLDVLEDSCFNHYRIVDNTMWYPYSCRVNRVTKIIDEVRQRLEIIYCVLYAYVYGLN